MDTWTCKCGNVNSSENTKCLKCWNFMLTPAERDALECHNKAAKESEHRYACSKTEQEFIEGTCGKYIKAFYQLAREPLINIINDQHNQITKLQELVKTAYPLSKAVIVPKKGDKVWTDTLDNGGRKFMYREPNLLHLTVTDVDEDGFFVSNHDLKRLFVDINKTWFWNKP